jgi:maltooligosyltrehalose synthase
MSDRLCAFSRRNGKSWIVASVPRLVGELVYNGGAPLGAVWRQSALRLPVEAPAQWVDVVSGERIEAGPDHQLMLSDVFRYFPVSLLYHEERADLSPTVEESIHATATPSVG